MNLSDFFLLCNIFINYFIYIIDIWRKRILFKKNQLALILLTLVMMLTVYFIKTPAQNNNPGDDPTTPTTGRLEVLSTMRLTLKNERNEKINELNNIIGSETATAAEINEAIEEKNRINSITECELLLELEIISMGYQDAFVHVTDSGIDVTVISSEHSISKANEIIKKTLLEFDGKYSNVCVEFESVEEVMGTVNNEAA